MGRMIDADKLKKDVLDLQNCYNGFSDTYDKACIIGVIDEQPSAQPEIIRCKDCKHYEIWQLKADYTDDKRYKPSVCTIGAYSVHRRPDWYCADAERREDAEIL